MTHTRYSVINVHPRGLVTPSPRDTHIISRQKQGARFFLKSSFWLKFNTFCLQTIICRQYLPGHISAYFSPDFKPSSIRGSLTHSLKKSIFTNKKIPKYPHFYFIATHIVTTYKIISNPIFLDQFST